MSGIIMAAAVSVMIPLRLSIYMLTCKQRLPGHGLGWMQDFLLYNAHVSQSNLIVMCVHMSLRFVQEVTVH